MSNLCEESRHNVLLVGGALSAKTWVAFLCHSQVQHLPKVWICFGFLFFFSTIILSIQRIYYDKDDDDFTSPSRSDSQAVFTTEAKVSKESDTACLRTWLAEMLTKSTHNINSQCSTVLLTKATRVSLVSKDIANFSPGPTWFAPWSSKQLQKSLWDGQLD